VAALPRHAEAARAATVLTTDCLGVTPGRDPNGPDPRRKLLQRIPNQALLHEDRAHHITDCADLRLQVSVGERGHRAEKSLEHSAGSVRALGIKLPAPHGDQIAAVLILLEKALDSVQAPSQHTLAVRDLAQAQQLDQVGGSVLA
jgi:hypothetical protein